MNAGAGQTLQDRDLVADREAGAVQGVMGPKQRMERIQGKRNDAESCGQLLPVQFAHVETAVVHPRLLDILFGHGIPGLYSSKRSCQFPIPSFPISLHEHLRRRALKRVIHGCGLGSAQRSVPNFWKARHRPFGRNVLKELLVPNFDLFSHDSADSDRIRPNS